MNKILIKLIIVSLVTAFIVGQEQEFKLKDGSKINGSIIGESDTELVVQTSFGAVTINRDNLVQKEFKIKMLSGEIFKGTKNSETETEIIFNTNIGTLKLDKLKIASIEEVSKKSSTGYVHRRRQGGLFGLLNNVSSSKDTDFSLGEEQLIDLFFDPTGYILPQSTLYLSGFSFGFGLTDKLQVTSKWTNFLAGDLNVRLKFKVFGNGNWEKQQAFSIGSHYHTRWSPKRKYEWVSGKFNIIEYNGQKDYSGEWNWGVDSNGYPCNSYESDCVDVNPNYNSNYGQWKQEGASSSKEYYWGGYYPLGAGYLEKDGVKVSHNSNGELILEDENLPDGYDENYTGYYSDWQPDNYYNINLETGNWDYDQSRYNMIELFSAYTFSSARNNLKGRVSHTIGANIQIAMMEETKYFYRAYYGLDVDLTRQLKVITELFYDPWYVESWEVTDYPLEFLFSGGGKEFRYCNDDVDYYYENENCFSENEIKESKKVPLFLDIGFIYAINESFRFGIHFQQPSLAFYWKI